MSVWLSSHVSQKPCVPILLNFLRMLPMAVDRSSFDDNAIHHVLPVLWMTSCFHNYNAENRTYSKATRMFRPVRKVAAPFEWQTTLFGRDLHLAATGAKSAVSYYILLRLSRQLAVNIYDFNQYASKMITFLFSFIITYWLSHTDLLT